MSTQKLDQIDDFLLGRMDEEEQRLFEEELSIDAELAARVEEQKAFLESLYVHEEYLDLKKELASYVKSEGNTVQKSPKTTFTRQRFISIISIAASVAAIVSLGIFLASDQFGLFNKRVDNISLLSEEVKDLSTKQRSLQEYVNEMVDIDDTRQRQLVGTCFPITHDGFVITSYHLVGRAKNIHVEVPGEPSVSYTAELVHHESKYDLALLFISDTSFEGFSSLPYGISESTKLLGTEIYTLGYPKKSIVFNEGSISSLSGYRDDTLSYQLSLSVNPGNSGAPVFDNTGDIVGIIHGKHTEKEGVAFAVKSEYVLDAVKNLPGHVKEISEDIPTFSSVVYQNRTTQIKKVAPFMLRLRVRN